MLISGDEQQWLAFRWPFFRDKIRSVCVSHANIIFNEIAENGRVSDSSWNEFVNAVTKDFDNRRAGQSELYGTAISLFADSTPLRQCLESVAKDIVGPNATKYRTLAFKRGLTRMRDIYLGGTEHRGKTWGRLDAISRKLAADSFSERSGEVDRCSMEHFIALAKHIKESHEKDRNLPRTIINIEEYFQEFCSDCRNMEVTEDLVLPDIFNMVSVLPDVEQQALNLHLCLEELDEEQRKFVEVNFKMGSPVEMSVAGFCTRMSIERRKFYRILERALGALKDCLTSKASESFGGVLGFRSAWD